MKTFIYKSLIICFLFFLLFHLTFGFVVKSYTNKFYNTFSKDKIYYIKDKIREEIKQANTKEKILDDNDAELLRNFINKILLEIN